MSKVLIMAGGTGGHIFPGLAVAKVLQEKGISIVWLGSLGGMENSLVPQANIPLYTIAIKGIRNKKWYSTFLLSWQLLKAIYQAVIFLRKERPAVVIGFGGFVAGPGGIAAKILGIPLIIHEQNSISGLTNRWLAKVATRVLTAFPNVFPSKCQPILVGNPVRERIAAIPSPSVRYASSHDKVNILVLGGSRGAQALNTFVPAAIARLTGVAFSIVHQSGEQGYASTVQQYENLSIQAKVVPFIDEMADSYAWADVIVCRAGALTVAEIAMVGIAAILVPYPFAADDHQMVNARYFSDQEAAICLPQADLSSTEELYLKLQMLVVDKDKRLLMANKMRCLRQENAVEKMVAQCFSAAKFSP